MRRKASKRNGKIYFYELTPLGHRSFRHKEQYNDLVEEAEAIAAWEANAFKASIELTGEPVGRV